jgi:hypothetical protein
MKVHLVCGYKRSGKDTFYKSLKSGIIKNINPGEDTGSELKPNPYFYIFSHSYNQNIDLREVFLEQASFASMVKKEIQKYFQISFKKSEVEDLCKDNLEFFDEEKEKYRTLRDYYIEHAMNMREKDSDHWAKATEKYIFCKQKDSREQFMITDWRFPNERIYFEKNFSSITYRIFRDEADDENFFDVTEHSLDNEITDFLVVGSLEDVEKAKLKFPHYKDYVLTQVLYV